jgi:6-phospho-3-hexuloisomerase
VVLLTPRKGDMPGIERPTSSQPMGSLVEQSLLLFLDAVVVRLMDETRETSAHMHQRHANLE